MAQCLKPQLLRYIAAHETLQARYTESETQHSQHSASELVAREQLQTRITELEERLAEAPRHHTSAQSVQSDSDDGDQESQSGTLLTEQPDRSRKKGRRSDSEQKKYREREMLKLYQHKWYRLSLQPVWTEHTLSTETRDLVTQCSDLELQLRNLVGGEGTVAERMVKSFRAALHSFRVLARGHALQSVQSAIFRQLRGGKHSKHVTREYCSGTQYSQRVGLTDYCSCDTPHVFKRGSAHTPAVTAGMVDTTVGAVLVKYSIQWYIRRRVHSSWLYWRERHLRAARQMAVDVTDTLTAQAPGTTAGTARAQTPSAVTEAAAAEGAAAEAAAAEVTATEGAASEGAAAEVAAAEGAASEGAAAAVAATECAASGGAAVKQSCAPDSSNCSTQLMAAFALAHRVWQQNWETIAASDSSEGADISCER